MEYALVDFHLATETNMGRAGVDTPTVMKICGWKSVQMFLRYNAVDDSDIQKANVGISLVLANNLDSQIPKC